MKIADFLLLILFINSYITCDIAYGQDPLSLHPLNPPRAPTHPQKTKTRNVSVWHRCPAQGHHHPHAGILQKMKLKKGHNSHNNWQILP